MFYYQSFFQIKFINEKNQLLLNFTLILNYIFYLLSIFSVIINIVILSSNKAIDL